MQRRTRPRRRARHMAVLGVLFGVGLAMIVVAGTKLMHGTSARTGVIASPNWGDPDAGPDMTTADRSRGRTSHRVTEQVVGRPVPAGSRLTFTRLHLGAPIVPVSAHGGVMAIPKDPHTLGWWSQGVAPGASSGSAVIVGHVNFAGVTGILDALPRTRAGDEITITERQTRLTYRVTAVRSYPKTSGIPADAFRRTGPARLVLITCGGSFDASTGNYLDNIVAYANPRPTLRPAS